MKYWIGAAAVLVVAFLTAISGINEYFFYAAFVVLQFMVLATAWNILGGYAGYVNFGTAAFFAIGSYTGVVLFKWLNAPLAVQIVAAAAVSGLLGFGVTSSRCGCAASSSPSPPWRSSSSWKP